jgi:hypothetical protein
MRDRIADYEVVRALDDPARPGMRFVAAPPPRLGLEVGSLEMGSVVIEVGPGEAADLLPDLSRWATAASGGGEGGSTPERGNLVVPLEVGPLEDGFPGLDPSTPAVWLSRLAAIDDTVTPDPVAVVGGAAAGLAALHRSGGIHGAVSAGRMLTTASSGVLDYPPLLGPRPPGLAVRVVTPGDLDGIAPEVARGEAPTAASDVWALGACLHFALTGRRIHPGLDGNVLLTAVQRVVFERPEIEAGDWTEMIAACCRIDPAERPTALAVAGGLALRRPSLQ